MQYTKTFKELHKSDADIAGGKGASLGEMLNAGIPVPDGFVVLSTTFDEFLHKAKLVEEIEAVLDGVDHKAVHSIDEASEKIQSLIKNAAMPEDIKAEIESQFGNLGSEFVAVRSSATAEDGADHAWAGQLDSYLNTTENSLLEKVQHCWASLFTPRAIFYRFEKGLHVTKISVAVVVQQMVNSELSGIAFSVHPVTEDRNQLIIEAGFGLGEAIVSGSVTPDSYVVEKEPRRIIDVSVSNQTRALYRKTGGGNEWINLEPQKAGSQVLNEAQILEFSKIVLTIENHYGFPCDIEWAYEAGKFYIVQSRPITTLSKGVTDYPDNYYFSIPLVKMGQWALGVLDSEIWFNEKTSFYFKELFGFPKGILAIINFTTGYAQPYIPEEYFKKLYAYIDTVNADDYQGLAKILETFYDFKKETYETVPFIIKKDLATVSIEELTEYYKTNRDWIHHSASFDQFGWIGETYWPPHMERILVEKHGITKDSPEYHRALFALTKPAHISTTLLEKGSVLDEAIKIKKGEQTIEAGAKKLTEKFGWMPVFAYGTPWDETHYVKDLEELGRTTLEALEAQHGPLASYQAIQKKDFDDVVKEHNITPREAQVFVDFSLALDARNEAEYIVSLCGNYVLPLYKEISKRFGVTIDELRKLYEAQVVACLEGKADIHDLLKKQGPIVGWGYTRDMEERINYSPEESAALFEHVEKTCTVIGQTEGEKGVCASPGKVIGKIRIVSAPAEQDKVEMGDILVTYATTVDYLPSMKKAGAIVTEVGGLTCHAAVVSREFGIPCVVSLKNAMTIFKDGDIVEVDADKGVVRILSDTKIKFIKEYTRDYSYMIEEGWHDVVLNLFKDYDGVINPNVPPVVYHMNEGTIEVWEHPKATSWILDTLQAKIKQDESFITNILDQHERELGEMKEYWQKKFVTTEAEFNEYIQKVYKYMYGFTFMYYTGMDDRTPKHLRDRALAIREKDTYFGSNDDMIRLSLQKMYPEIKGLETTLLLSDVGHLPSKTILEGRKKASVLENGVIFIGSLSKYQSEHTDHIFESETPPTDSKSLTGQIGNKGYAKGRVRILKRKEQIEEMQEGEIIVSAMTTPEFVPAMKKAAAIITDEGGITCHAAIVARELNKPCVIGTKFATQLLHDGDEVEVDADKGIVKILFKKAQLPRWEKVLQRNFPPLAWTAGAYYEFRGFKIGPMTWIRDREIQVKYNTVQSYMIQDPTAFYTSNITELLKEKNKKFEKAIDENNAIVMKLVEDEPGKKLKHLHQLNENHKLAYALMLIGFDVAIDIRAKIDEVIQTKSDGFEAYLATPWKPTAIQREQIAATKAKEDIATKPAKKEKILKELAFEFGYLHQDYLGKPWTPEDYEKSFSDNITLQSGMDQSFDVSSLSDYEQYLVSLFKKMTYMYEEGRNAMVRDVWAMKETAAALGLDPEALLYMTAGEVEQFSLGKTAMISADTVAERKKAFALHFDNGQYAEYFGEAEVKKLINEQHIAQFWEVSNDSETSLKGSIAYKGYAKGKARLVFTQEDANKVEEGEILISPMTQVEFLSGIRKCAAIVTDEGGIICHAAIVSREFGKPCILATQKATKVFKTGDMVEVDADNGVVRIVK
ncbi:MAG: PEP/pyruvate-binding domain-containing protein [bacterium]